MDYKIAAIGDRDTVLGFRAIGFTVFFIEEPDDALQTIRKLIKGGEYAIIYLTEPLMEALGEKLAEYRDLTLPAIIAIPDVSGSTGLGVGAIKKSVERAVGADILFKE